MFVCVCLCVCVFVCACAFVYLFVIVCMFVRVGWGTGWRMIKESFELFVNGPSSLPLRTLGSPLAHPSQLGPWLV